MADDVWPDVKAIRLRKGDRLLLCTDGLMSMVMDEEIACMLARERNPWAACRALTEAANVSGGAATTTVVVVDYLPPQS